MRRAAVLVAGVALVLAACGGPPPHSGADLINAQLSPSLAQWLIGPIARLATVDEVHGYLAITDDAAATAFIEAFWARRDNDPARAGNPLRELFEQREREADRRFSEAGYLGRRTDRGTVFVVFGEPSKIDFELNPHQGSPPVEHWTYAPGGAVGLNGRPAPAVFRFVNNGDLTVFYNKPIDDRGALPERP